MGSEVAILELMHGLDQAVREIGDMETKLEVYDQLLSGVRSTMAHLGSQYSATLVENRNLQALLREVDELVVRETHSHTPQAPSVSSVDQVGP